MHTEYETSRELPDCCKQMDMCTGPCSGRSCGAEQFREASLRGESLKANSTSPWEKNRGFPGEETEWTQARCRMGT